MKKYFGLRGNSLHRAIATIAGIGFILFGYDQGVMSGFLTLPEFVKTFPEMDTVNPNLSAHQITFHSKVQGVVIAIYEIGCMFGALGTLWAGDKFGRRRTVFGGAIIMCLGAAIQCSAFTLSQFVVGRIIIGIGNGVVTATVPVWQSECAKPHRRGPMVMIEGALIIFGLALAYWVDFAFYFVVGQVNWRFPIAFQCLFAGILIVSILELPESPRWLIKKNKVEEAKVIFAALDGIPLDDPFIQVQVREVIGSLSKEAGLRAALKTMCTNGTKKHFHRSMLAIWSQAMQQLSGTNLITYYATSIYEVSIGLSPVNARIVGACQNTAYVFVACIAIFTIERVRRRKLLPLGSLGQASSMAILAGTVYLATHGNSHAGIAAALLIFVFNAFFGLGWLGIPWLYPAEISSLEIRAPVNGLSTATDWVLNFMVVMITPVAFNSIDVYTYVIFAVMNLLMFFVVLGLYPETSHRSLEEIDHIFENSNPWTPWDVVKIAREPLSNIPLWRIQMMHQKPKPVLIWLSPALRRMKIYSIKSEHNKTYRARSVYAGLRPFITVAVFNDEAGDGAFFTAQAAANVLKELVKTRKIKQGNIIFTASVSSLVVNFPQKQAPYNASKAGLVQLAKCLAVEWAAFARVNCVSTGYIETDLLSAHPQKWRDRWFSMIPSERLCQTYELKGTYVYLASEALSYMTGAELIVDGAFTIT